MLLLALLLPTIVIADSTPLQVTPPPTIEEPREVKPTIKASVTKYGWTGNPMASGKYPYVGAVATSDRSIPLGTDIYIEGVKYKVEDRTASWIQAKHGLTIDIYSDESRTQMLAFGRQTKNIQIGTK